MTVEDVRLDPAVHGDDPARPPGAAVLTMQVRDLVLDYTVHENRRAALRDRFVKREGTGRSVVHALKGVSFEAYEGDSIGVVGSNGSGKSTLLAAVAGMLPPTSGEIYVSELPKLLGVNATLVPASSGLRNIRLGCLALGLKAAEVEKRIDSIVGFADLGAAIHRPLRTYSSGMRARLMFAIATSVTPRILLIDEALAVGDKAFKAKARGRIMEIIEHAGTMLYVSHAGAEVRRLCNRAIWIEQGELLADGPVDEVLDRYEGNDRDDDS